MSKDLSHSGLSKELFEQLFKEHFVHLCNFSFQYVRDHDIAKDIAQRVFLKLWEKRDRMDPEKQIKSYLFTAVRNQSLNHIRDHKKYRSHVLDIEISDIDVSFVEEDEGVSDLQKKVSKAIDTLPEKCQKVFRMNRFEEMKYKEIAEELDISLKTVEAHISKALKHLREQLSAYLTSICIIMVFFEWLT